MARGLDLSALTRAERTVLIGGALLFANGFLPWWYRTQTIRGMVSYNAGLTGPAIVAVIAGALAAVAVLSRAAIWPEPAPAKDGLVYTLLGLLALGASIATATTDTDAWLGTYAGIILAAILTLGGLRRRRERAGGWT